MKEQLAKYVNDGLLRQIKSIKDYKVYMSAPCAVFLAVHHEHKLAYMIRAQDNGVKRFTDLWEAWIDNPVERDLTNCKTFTAATRSTLRSEWEIYQGGPNVSEGIFIRRMIADSGYQQLVARELDIYQSPVKMYHEAYVRHIPTGVTFTRGTTQVCSNRENYWIRTTGADLRKRLENMTASHKDRAKLEYLEKIFSNHPQTEFEVTVHWPEQGQERKDLKFAIRYNQEAIDNFEMPKVVKADAWRAGGFSDLIQKKRKK